MSQVVTTIDVSGFKNFKLEKDNPMYNPRFTGFDYERTCQRMLWAGIQFLEKYHIIIPPNKRFSKDIKDHLSKQFNMVTNDGDYSGAQYGAVLGHLTYIAQHGKQKWIDQFKDQKTRIYQLNLKSLYKDRPKTKNMFVKPEWKPKWVMPK